MTRLCERPGCSAPAAVAYGMDSEHLLVWLAIVAEDAMPVRVGMLCRRHADAMVVPRGWTLDDRREPRPRLFRVVDAPAPPANHPSRGRARQRTRPAESAEPPLQLDFDVVPEVAADLVADVAADVVEDVVAEVVVSADRGPDALITVAEIVPGERDPDETRALPWRPVFDHDDDLGGLLHAKSPLLSRAFRSRDVPPRPDGSAAAASDQ